MKDCSVHHACTICEKNHHTLLHFISTIEAAPNISNTTKTAPNITDTPLNISDTSQNLSALTPRSQYEVMLQTAIVYVIGPGGQLVPCRSLLDPGSQSSFISKSLKSKLRLSAVCANVRINGIGGIHAGNVDEMVNVVLHLSNESHDSSSLCVNAIVLDRISENIPTRRVSLNWPHLDVLKLADPYFCEPSAVDLLLGADVYPMLLNEDFKVIANPSGELKAINTVLGYVITGPVKIFNSCITTNILTHHASVDYSDELLKQFWELEEILIFIWMIVCLELMILNVQ